MLKSTLHSVVVKSGKAGSGSYGVTLWGRQRSKASPCFFLNSLPCTVVTAAPKQLLSMWKLIWGIHIDLFVKQAGEIELQRFISYYGQAYDTAIVLHCNPETQRISLITTHIFSQVVVIQWEAYVLKQFSLISWDQGDHISTWRLSNIPCYLGRLAPWCECELMV